MNNALACGDFWFWFTRPFAEFLGAAALAVVLLATVAIAAAAGLLIASLWHRPVKVKPSK